MTPESSEGLLWWSKTQSPKAYMSIRDADLYEELLLRLARTKRDRPLEVVEWGSGRSTVWYTRFLDMLRVPYRWLVLEHDRSYFAKHVAPQLSDRSNADVRMFEALPPELSSCFAPTGVHAVVFDAGPLDPRRQVGDRLVDLDDYVAVPARLGRPIDLAIVDGRKRRRCVLAASALIRQGGYVILHDARRRQYQCAFPAFQSGRHFGDDWWIGAQHETAFADVVPWHGFLKPSDPPPGILPSGRG